VESKTTLRFLTFVLSKALKHLPLEFLLSWLPDYVQKKSRMMENITRLSTASTYPTSNL
jgi:hypothetical protein